MTRLQVYVFVMRKSSTFFADIQIKNTAHALTTEEVAALEILRGTGVNIVKAALVARAALEAGRYKVKRALKCVALGVEELKRQEKTVSFEKAVEGGAGGKKRAESEDAERLPLLD